MIIEYYSNAFSTATNGKKLAAVYELRPGPERKRVVSPQMSNPDVAATFRRLADLLEIRGEEVYKVTAYRRAAEGISQLPEAVAAVRARGGLEAIPGVGKAIAQKLRDLLDTGSFKLLDEVRSEFPSGVADLLVVPDIGPKRARVLYQELGIDSLPALRSALEEGRLETLAGVGPKGAQRIAEGLRSLQTEDERLPLGVARGIGSEIMELLRQGGLGIARIEMAGSARRMRDTMGDLDIVAAADDPQAVVEAFTALPSIARVEMKGQNRCRALLQNGFPVDLRVLPEQHWGSLLHHFTGNKYHDIRLRDMALERGAHLSEYGYKVGDKLTACATEEEVYAYLDMQYIPPTMREDSGEIDLALGGRLPATVQVDQLRGDLHTHSEWSDGTRTIRDLALAARARGYEYLCVTDHSQSLGVANGLSPERLARQRLEIEGLADELAPFRVLQGVELEVRGDGSMDLPDVVLAKLDLVVASVHSGLRQGRERVTSRALAAIRHPLVDILAHPTGRIVGGRSGGDFDMDALYTEASRTGTVLEINSDPARLDLRDSHARAAVSHGCTVSIDSDAHSTEGLGNVFYGVAVASRAWIEPDRVLNTLPLDAVLTRLKRSRL